MMNEALANFIGKEGFNWWIGQVENDGAKSVSYTHLRAHET
mgnify:CR=1 FL=1